MKFSKVLANFAAISIVCASCAPLAMDYRIRFSIENEADHPIGFYVAEGEDGVCCPDSLPLTNEGVVYDTREQMWSGIEAHFRTWEQYFENLPCDTLSIFIFHTDTLNKYSWEEVRDGYKILRRYDLGIEDIKQMGRIVYP